MVACNGGEARGGWYDSGCEMMMMIMDGTVVGSNGDESWMVEDGHGGDDDDVGSSGVGPWCLQRSGRVVVGVVVWEWISSARWRRKKVMVMEERGHMEVASRPEVGEESGGFGGGQQCSRARGEGGGEEVDARGGGGGDAGG